MKKLKNVLEMLKYNLKALVSFELVYKMITSIIFVPLFLSMFQMTMKVTGYSYLTLENVFSFVLNPITIVMILLLIVFMTFYSLIDISAIILIIKKR